ncbi:hypothetical protein DENSPDRAFT_188959 [Dentipellis sp. KUC8613]|nr:hypothetical protein DENSPDRAFT_188959 [Dentipellis sp. KUC8613]
MISYWKLLPSQNIVIVLNLSTIYASTKVALTETDHVTLSHDQEPSKPPAIAGGFDWRPRQQQLTGASKV